ncbi:hypothetical protein [Bacillus sp. JJ722]
MKKQTSNKYTVAGTNIEEVKQLNANSGLTYNEIKALIQQQYENKNK